MGASHEQVNVYTCTLGTVLFRSSVMPQNTAAAMPESTARQANTVATAMRCVTTSRSAGVHLTLGYTTDARANCRWHRACERLGTCTTMSAMARAVCPHDAPAGRILARAPCCQCGLTLI